MRNGYSDPRIAASPQTASHNIGLFLDLNEIPQPEMTQPACRAALGIAVDLEFIRIRHAIERQAGLRAH
jgi:hypothetical protein